MSEEAAVVTPPTVAPAVAPPVAAPVKKKKRIPNPGTFENSSKACSDVLKSKCFGGAFFAMKYKLDDSIANNVVVGVESNLDNDLPHKRALDYTLDVKSDDKSKTLAISMDDDFGLSVQYSQKLSKTFSMKGKYENKKKSLLEAGLDISLAETCINTKLVSGSNALQLPFSFMHSLTRNVAVGMSSPDLIGLANAGMGGNKGRSRRGASADLSSALKEVAIVGRYTQRLRATGIDILTLKVQPDQYVHASYTKQYSPELALSSCLIYALQPHKHKSVSSALQAQQSVVNVGCMYKFSSFNFQARLNSEGQVSSYLESMLNAAAGVRMSAEYNHFTGDSRFGAGLRIG